MHSGKKLVTHNVVFSTILIEALCGLFFVSPANAGGFYLQEQSGLEAGRAYSGEAAAADNASTVFYNPAGMTELGGTHVDIGGNVLFVNSRQKDQSTTRTVPGVPEDIVTGGNDGGNPFSQPIAIPSGYLTSQVTDNLWLGLGISSPFGVVVQYDDGFFGRYDSLRSDLFTINVQPSVAVKLNENISVGGGVDLQYIDVELTNALPNLSPLQPDGKLDVNGDDWSVGWNAGILATLGEIRVGAHYRSKIEHNLKGTYQISGLQGPLAGANGQLDATAPIALPDIATVSAMYGVGKPLRFYASLRWYNWSVFDRIEIRPEGSEPVISQQNYRDTWSGALGAEYDLSERLTIRAGTMYDQTPTQDEFRSTRVPDGNRTWLTGGLTYGLSDRFSINLAYAHVFVSDEVVNRTDSFYGDTPAQISTSTRSKNTGDADIVAFSISANF